MKATTKRKRRKQIRHKAPPHNPWVIDDGTTCFDKIDMAHGVTALVRGRVILRYDPTVFVTFDGSNEDHGNGTREHIWTIDPKMHEEFLNDFNLCVCDIDGGDIRQLLSERLKGIAAKFVQIACDLDDIMEHEREALP